jgi:acyl transferase domain-containing protein
MDYAVDAVLTADRSLFELFKRLAIHPDVIVGHSNGEIMALEAAGAIKLTGEEKRRRYTLEGSKMIQGFFTEKAIPEANLIAAGGIDQKTTIEAVEASGSQVYIAMQNCPHQIVLCAGKEHIEGVVERLRSAGALCQVLPFSRPYHKRWVKIRLLKKRLPMPRKI